MTDNQWDHDSKEDVATIDADTDESVVIADVEHPAILSGTTLAKFGGLPMLKGSQMRTAAGWFLLEYGLGGSGKTTLIRTLLDAERVPTTPIAYIDLDHHADPLYDLPDDAIDFFPVASSTKAWAAIRTFFKAAGEKGEFPWKTLVLDSLHELQENNLLAITQTQVTLPEYGRSQREILTVLKLLRDFSLSSGVNVIVTCGAEPETDEMSHILRYGLALTPKLASRVRLVANNIAYVEEETRAPYNHVLHFEPSQRYITKVAASPNSYSRVQVSPSLGHIIDTVKGGVPWSKFKQQHEPPQRVAATQAQRTQKPERGDDNPED